MRLAVFFERDGVLNLARSERGHQLAPRTMEEFQVNPEAIAPLRELKEAGFLLVATTNQPGISHGCLNRRELDRMHQVLKQALKLDDILMCPHDESDECPCRKPRSGMFQEAGFKWHLDLERSYIVSDKWQDAQAAHLIGATSLLLESPWTGKGHHDFILKTLAEVPGKISQLHHSPVLAMHQV